MNVEVPVFVVINKDLQIFCEDRLNIHKNSIMNSLAQFNQNELTATLLDLSNDCQKLNITHLSSLSFKIAYQIENSASPIETVSRNLSEFIFTSASLKGL